MSLIIITKDRPKDLAHCYASIENLTEYPNEFILIDSSIDTLSKQLTHNFAKRIPFPVRYIHEPRRGFPAARNRGLTAAKYSWVIFTDDDCIVDPKFISAAKVSMKKYPKAVAIAGESISYYKHNLMSHVATINEGYWKSCVRRGDRIYDLETLDNKNIAYNMTFFKQHNIFYDETRTQFDGASDDCDLGMQLQKAGGQAYYEKNMVVYHKDLTKLALYTKHLLQRTSAHATYEKKWKSYRLSAGLDPVKRDRFLLFFRQYIRSNGLSFIENMMLFGLLVYTMILVRAVKWAQHYR